MYVISYENKMKITNDYKYWNWHEMEYLRNKKFMIQFSYVEYVIVISICQ